MLIELREVLKDEINIVKSLLNLLEEQHSYLVNQEVFNLEGIIPKIQEASKSLAFIENKRRKLVNNESMSQVVDKLKNEEIETLYKEVLGLLNEAEVQKYSNELLIKHSLSYTNSMLNMLKPRKEVNTYNGYGKLKK
ncbi:flagellar protein FlgN [Clostridium tunisiense]|uniref:flagellar protein FlgN n=1 Tax=Clostridium tunisiense TaxID=219748 RepID=UPI0002F0E920|nr:flagellar protein FlgN [Clostridium tunisiense]